MSPAITQDHMVQRQNWMNTSTVCLMILMMLLLGGKDRYQIPIDIFSVPASQVYDERMLSVSGELSSGERSRALKTLRIMTFLKLKLMFM